jgi:hypothetical protein
MRGYNILIKYWYNTNISVEWIGLGSWVCFLQKQGAKMQVLKQSAPTMKPRVIFTKSGGPKCKTMLPVLFRSSNRDLMTWTTTKFHPRIEQPTPSAAQFLSSRNLSGWKRRLVAGATSVEQDVPGHAHRTVLFLNMEDYSH